jgi:hypothetical protein
MAFDVRLRIPPFDDRLRIPPFDDRLRIPPFDFLVPFFGIL